MKKKNTILCSAQVCPRTRGLLARAAPAVHHLFDDLSTSSGLSTKTKRFGILHSFCHKNAYSFSRHMRK